MEIISNYNKVWDSYTSSWSEANPLKRKLILEKNLTGDCIYTDPNIQAVGYEHISDYMEHFQKKFPGASFETTQYKEHHQQGLIHWNMKDAKGNIIGTGISFCLYSNDERLMKMTGFF